MGLQNVKFLFIGILGILFLVGCAAKVDHGFVFDTEAKIKVGNINNNSNQQINVDAENMLKSALEKALKEEEIFWNGIGKHFTLNLKIINYEMGNAFKRWLLPFYGSTILNIEGELIDTNGASVSTFTHKRSIDAGGFYTIGGWESIFNEVAKDIANDLKTRMTDEAPGFYVELAPWLEKTETYIPKSEISKKIHFIPFEDKRTEKNRIGERHAAFNVSMGNIYLNRRVTGYIDEAIQNELLASGNQLVKAGDEDLILTGEVIKFWVWTDTTPIYWDLKSEIKIVLKIMKPNESKIILAETYLFQSSLRTYVWPTEKLASRVLSESINGLMVSIRSDSIWSKEN